MSLGNFLGDVFTGNFSHAYERIKDWWSTTLPSIKDFLTKVATDEGKILEGLISVAAQDVLAGGLTTASFVAAGKDVLAKLISQNITLFNMQYVMGLLNIEVASKAPPAA